jgi:CDGSH-type Zn-finger protein
MNETRTVPRVLISKDGPYVVFGGVPLATQTITADAEGGSETWTEGLVYPAQEKYALCRCGRSETKPFCDGKHAEVKFRGD